MTLTRKSRARGRQSKKVTISLPDDLFEELERLRRGQKVDRSSWIQNAVSASVAREQMAEKDRAYIESYRNDPEDVNDEEAAMFAKLAAGTWAGLDE